MNHKINQKPFWCEEGGFFGDYLGIDAHAGRVAVLYMHHLETKGLGLSGALFDFEPGTQNAKNPPQTGA